MAKKTLVLNDIAKTFDWILRPELAQDWDNVGLLAGDPSQRVRRVMVCIDLTPAVLREAQSRRAELVLAYHPPLFKAIKTVRADRQEVIFHAVRAGLAIYSIHTALDVLPGGTSDVLADLVDLKNRRPIDPINQGEKKTKLVVFVPKANVEKVAQAIFAVGAGQIGEYDSCSFRSEGMGTFRGSDAAQPAVGKAGQFEAVDEVRLEVLMDNASLPDAIQAIRKTHPYEEPAFDIYPLTTISDEPMGLGRVGELAKPSELKTIVSKIKRRTKLKHLQIADAGVKQIRRVAVGPGACGDLIEPLGGKIDLFITGEVRHHTALAAVRKGISVICLGHGNSERITMPALRDMLSPSLPELEFQISDRDEDPLTIE